jgi:hypothetical protein
MLHDVFLKRGPRAAPPRNSPKLFISPSLSSDSAALFIRASTFAALFLAPPNIHIIWRMKKFSSNLMGIRLSSRFIFKKAFFPLFSQQVNLRVEFFAFLELK